MIVTVFVYGTLQRGQCREACWPSHPRSIEPGWIEASLYDLGPYPAIAPGRDRVLGELWQFSPADLPEVLRQLDIIEGTDQPGERNEYDRQQVEAYRLDGTSVWAHTYYYARPELLVDAQRVRGGPLLSGGNYVVWPAGERAD